MAQLGQEWYVVHYAVRESRRCVVSRLVPGLLRVDQRQSTRSSRSRKATESKFCRAAFRYVSPCQAASPPPATGATRPIPTTLPITGRLLLFRRPLLRVIGVAQRAGPRTLPKIYRSHRAEYHVGSSRPAGVVTLAAHLAAVAVVAAALWNQPSWRTSMIETVRCWYGMIRLQ
jgi:hypothetical protein